MVSLSKGYLATPLVISSGPAFLFFAIGMGKEFYRPSSRGINNAFFNSAVLLLLFLHFTIAVRRNRATLRTLCLKSSSAKYPISLFTSSTFYRTQFSQILFLFITRIQLGLEFPKTYFLFQISPEWLLTFTYLLTCCLWLFMSSPRRWECSLQLSCFLSEPSLESPVMSVFLACTSELSSLYWLSTATSLGIC